jgi:hypothetical protein
MSIYKYLYLTESGKYQAYNKPDDYFSKRYKKRLSINVSEEFNGADFYFDLNSWFWPWHDVAKRDRKWSDGTHLSNFKASVIAFDILISENRYIHAPIVFTGTLLWGYTKQFFKGLL